MILDPLEQKVRDTIVAFPWWNFGLDQVGQADPEYAAHLAQVILETIRSEGW